MTVTMDTEIKDGIRHDDDRAGPGSRNGSDSGNQALSSGPPSRQGSAGTGTGLKSQAAFIHKLYSMLEDPSLSHLISWTPSNESFAICPGEEFSKVLSQYFKHTNVSSFVRQLNMYGFHKVNDNFHGSNSASSGGGPGNSGSGSGSGPDSSQWEFKHGGGSFKRGDVESLRAIKRRASRQSVVNRDNLQLKSVSLSVPSTPIGSRAGPDYDGATAAATAQAPYPPPQSQIPGSQVPPQGVPGVPQTAGYSQQSQTKPQLSGQAQNGPQGPSKQGSGSASAPSTVTPAGQPAMGYNGGAAGGGNGAVHPHHVAELESRLGALEHTLFYLQDSNVRLYSCNSVLTGALKKTQLDLGQIMTVVQRLTMALPSKDSSSSSAAPSNLTPHDHNDRDDPSLSFSPSLLHAELERLRSDIHRRNSILSHLDDQPPPAPVGYPSQYQLQQQQQSLQQQQQQQPIQGHPMHGHQPQFHAPPYFQPARYQAGPGGHLVPVYTSQSLPLPLPQSYGAGGSGGAGPGYGPVATPPTKAEISFQSSNRERNPSVFYDPLAPVPAGSGKGTTPVPGSPQGVPPGGAVGTAPAAGAGAGAQVGDDGQQPHGGPGVVPAHHVTGRYTSGSSASTAPGASNPTSPLPADSQASTPGPGPGPKLTHYPIHSDPVGPVLPPPLTREQRPGSFPLTALAQRNAGVKGLPVHPDQLDQPFRRHTSGELIYNAPPTSLSTLPGLTDGGTNGSTPSVGTPPSSGYDVSPPKGRNGSRQGSSVQSLLNPMSSEEEKDGRESKRLKTES